MGLEALPEVPGRPCQLHTLAEFFCKFLECVCICFPRHHNTHRVWLSHPAKRIDRRPGQCNVKSAKQSDSQMPKILRRSRVSHPRKLHPFVCIDFIKQPTWLLFVSDSQHDLRSLFLMAYMGSCQSSFFKRNAASSKVPSNMTCHIPLPLATQSFSSLTACTGP